jgi:hypothetical protein
MASGKRQFEEQIKTRKTAKAKPMPSGTVNHSGPRPNPPRRRGEEQASGVEKPGRQQEQLGGQPADDPQDRRNVVTVAAGNSPRQPTTA